MAAAIIATGLGVAGFVASGLYNVAATSPHLTVTRLLLEFGMIRSVKFHAREIEAPPLDDPALIERGLRHFETACANCHGEVGVDQFGEQLLPTAPPLSSKVPDWTAPELFWIVKHGIKMTGMPSWEAPGRDDEVWAVVAFLLRLPDIAPVASRPLDVDGQLIATAGPPSQAIAACVRCHRMRGEGSANGAFPRLSYQSADYLLGSLKRYASGERPSGIMAPVARALTERQMRSVAEHYASIGPAGAFAEPVREQAADPLMIQQGGALAAAGDEAAGIQPCDRCHGADGQGTSSVPALAGQYRSYLEQQLILWKRGERDRDPNGVMTRVARGLSLEDIRAVGAYFSALTPPQQPPQLRD